MCTKGIDCDECNQRERTCKVHVKCAIVGLPKNKLAHTRITTGVAVHKPNIYADPGDKDMFRLLDTPSLKKHQVIYAVMDTHNFNKAYIDLNGHFHTDPAEEMNIF